jgi:membrane fusion protein, type I secretion system
VSRELITIPQSSQASLAHIRSGMRWHLAVGGLAFLAIVFGLGGMAATIDFAGAIVTQGRLVVDSSVKKVQHVTGGTVAEIKVKDGDQVKAGDLLIRLDPTLAAANLAIYSKGIDEIMVRRARLQAERDGLDKITFPDDILARASEPAIAELTKMETSQFESRHAAREGQKSQLSKKIAELEQQTTGIEAEEDAIKRQSKFTKEELAGLHRLSKDLVPIDRMSSVERQDAQYDGQLGQLIAEAGQAGAEIAQAQLQILQVDEDMRTDVAKQLSEDESKLNEMAEHKIAAEDQLEKLDIRAPQDGTVYQLAVHGVGGVVGAGEPIMMIVPRNDVLVVEARIEPNDVDRVHVGSEAGLRFTSLGSRTTPEFTGKVATISPDIVVDQRTGAGYYVARVALPPEAMQKLGEKLVPGMPVEVLIATDKRTVLSYLVRPLGDQLMHTFRER